MQVPNVFLNLADAIGNANNPEELCIAVGNALSAVCESNMQETFAQRVREIIDAIKAAARIEAAARNDEDAEDANAD